MLTPENPFDNTVWDSNSREQAAEDPMHGPSAVFPMLSIPPMPRGDGTYYQPGAYYTLGTNIFDANGMPLIQIGTARSTVQITRAMFELDEWCQASRLGKEALTALEARRQRARLERNGAAHCFKPSDVCAGGKRIGDCPTAQATINAAQRYARIPKEKRPSEGLVWNPLDWLGRGACAGCSLRCKVAIQTCDGEPTGITRFSNMLPSPSAT